MTSVTEITSIKAQGEAEFHVRLLDPAGQEVHFDSELIEGRESVSGRAQTFSPRMEAAAGSRLPAGRYLLEAEIAQGTGKIDPLDIPLEIGIQLLKPGEDPGLVRTGGAIPAPKPSPTATPKATVDDSSSDGGSDSSWPLVIGVALARPADRAGGGGRPGPPEAGVRQVHALGLAVVLALVLAAPAAAQSTRTVPPTSSRWSAAGRSTPHRSSSRASTATPSCRPSTSTTRSRSRPGRRLHLTGATDQPKDVLLIRDLGVPAVDLTIQSPTRMESSSSGDRPSRRGPRASDGEGAPTSSEPAAEASDDTDVSGPWTGSGVYFLSVQAVWRGSESEPPKAEIPFHFTISLEGQEQARVTPTPTPSPTATPTATATPGADGSGGSGAVAAGAGIGGLLIGVIAGIAMLRRRR